jgi:hypothetical protein
MPQAFIAQLMLPLGKQYAGTTSGPERWPSIQDWLAEHHSVRSYRVIDDMPHEFPDSKGARELAVRPPQLGSVTSK